jgi:hypothetical protein
LVLNACTEYFQMLERQGFVTGDCLQMPHDLQADVVLPIIKYVPFLLSIVYVLKRHKILKTVSVMIHGHYCFHRKRIRQHLNLVF